MITIAQLNDIPALCDLLTELFSQETEFTPEPVLQARALANIISNPELGTILILKQQDKIVAMVNLLYSVSTALGGKVVLLEDMIVSASARGQGLGSQLLTEAIAYAKQQGCLRITLLTDSSNHSAQSFYAKHGFHASSMQPFRLLLNNDL